MEKSRKKVAPKPRTRGYTAKQESAGIVNDPAWQYSIAKNPKKKRHSANYSKRTLSYWLGMQPVGKKDGLSYFDIIALSEAGLTKKSVYKLAEFLGVSRKYMAEEIFAISVKTIERKDPSAKLDKRTSSHALEIARVLQHAYDVFRNEELMGRWLNRENRGMRNQRPVQLFSTLSGLILVNDILGRIQEGIYT